MVEYRVWSESADLIFSGTDRDEASEWLAEAVADHIAYAECRGCGVLTDPGAHGYSIQIIDGDRDVTGDPSYN
ncbi:hypothetical protein [Micromonospora avicenniae]|uniref:hypothetical protein n=1 Tax=Micromonospora avicenniae TaxID=1198245 RepID=UPI00332D6DB9